MFADSRVDRLYHIVGVLLILTAIAFFAVPALTHAQVAIEADAKVDVVINGIRFNERGVVFGDRTYVAVADVAESIGARYTYEPSSNVAFVQSGDYLNLNIEGMQRLNPKLKRYYEASKAGGDVDAIQYAAIPGAFLGVVVSPGGELLAFNFVIPAELFDHHPWFDQPEGDPMYAEVGGGIYTQHLYVVDPSLVRSQSDATQPIIAFNGFALALADDAIGWLDGELYVRLRDIAEASGGGVGWNIATRTASAKVVEGHPLFLPYLLMWNDNLEDYELLDQYIPGSGYYVGIPGPGISFTLSGDGRVASFVSMMEPDWVYWQPWFDQSQDQPETFSNGPLYTIHHYVLPFDQIVE